SSKLHWCIPRYKPLMQGCQSHRELDRRARLSTRRKRKRLVHHREDPPVRRVDHDCGSVHIPERIDRGLSDNGIFTRGDVRPEDVALGERTGCETLVRAMSAPVQSCVMEL